MGGGLTQCPLAAGEDCEVDTKEANSPSPFWSQSPDDLFRELGSSPTGLEPGAAQQRLRSTSSLFDFISFGALLGLFHAGERLFHTGWFTESLMT